MNLGEGEDEGKVHQQNRDRGEVRMEVSGRNQNNKCQHKKKKTTIAQALRMNTKKLCLVKKKIPWPVNEYLERE